MAAGQRRCRPRRPQAALAGRGAPAPDARPGRARAAPGGGGTVPRRRWTKFLSLERSQSVTFDCFLFSFFFLSLFFNLHLASLL